MASEEGVYLYHRMTLPPNLGHSWVVFCGMVPNFVFNKVVQQSCSTMDLNKAVPPW